MFENENEKKNTYACFALSNLISYKYELKKQKQIKSVALELNKEGNEFYSQSSYVNAIKKYIRTVKVIENARLRNEEEEVEIGRVLLKSYHNMAQSYLKIGRYGRAIWCARKVLDR